MVNSQNETVIVPKLFEKNYLYTINPSQFIIVSENYQQFVLKMIINQSIFNFPIENDLKNFVDLKFIFGVSEFAVLY